MQAPREQAEEVRIQLARLLQAVAQVYGQVCIEVGAHVHRPVDGWAFGRSVCGAFVCVHVFVCVHAFCTLRQRNPMTIRGLRL